MKTYTIRRELATGVEEHAPWAYETKREAIRNCLSLAKNSNAHDVVAYVVFLKEEQVFRAAKRP